MSHTCRYLNLVYGFERRPHFLFDVEGGTVADRLPPPLLQLRLDDGEDGLDSVEVGAVRRPVDVLKAEFVHPLLRLPADMDAQVVHVDADVVEGPLAAQLLKVDPELPLVDGPVEEHQVLEAHLCGDARKGSNRCPRDLALVDLGAMSLGAPLSLLHCRLCHHHFVEADNPKASLDAALQLRP